MAAASVEQTFLDELKRWHAAGNRDLDAPLNNGRTRLTRAAGNGWCSIIDWLVAHGAAVDRGYSPAGLTPLHFAVENDKLDAARHLLDAGARIDSPCRMRRTALHLAALRGRVHMCAPRVLPCPHAV